MLQVTRISLNANNSENDEYSKAFYVMIYIPVEL